MKRKISVSFWVFLSFVFIELAIFLGVYLATYDRNLVSNIFFGISVLFLILLCAQYFLFKRIVKQNKKLEIKQAEYEKQNLKKSSKKEKTFKNENLDKNEKNNVLNIFVLIGPFLASFTIALVMSLV